MIYLNMGSGTDLMYLDKCIYDLRLEVCTATSLGNIYIDRIELLSTMPSGSPTVTITSSTSGVTDGSSTETQRLDCFSR